MLTTDVSPAMPAQNKAALQWKEAHLSFRGAAFHLLSSHLPICHKQSYLLLLPVDGGARVIHFQAAVRGCRET